MVTDRLKEPSTYAGLAALLGLAGFHLTPDAYQGLVGVVSALAGFAAIVLPEHKA